ncbi:MAG: hypothetical protein ACAI44_15230 [Candidatus Sericytochromatia bacterium]
MAMKRLNIQLDEQELQQLRLVGFMEKKSVASVIREATAVYLESKKELRNKAAEALFASDAEVDLAMQASFDDFDDVYTKLAQ